MKAGRLAIGAGIILAVSAAAWAVPYVPLPPGGNYVSTAHRMFAEVFVEVLPGQQLQLPGGPVLGPGYYNDVAIGYTEDDNGAADGGQPNFVLYRGALASTTGAPYPDPTPPNQLTVLLVDQPTATGTVISDLYTGKGQFEGVTAGRVFAGGTVDSHNSFDANGYPNLPVPIPLAIADDPTSGTQLTFALYNAYVEELELEPSRARFDAQYQLVDKDNDGRGLHFDIYADATPDTALQAPPGGERYQSHVYTDTPPDPVPPMETRPELPLRDEDGRLLIGMNDGTYFDRNGVGWGSLDWMGNYADPDVGPDDDMVMWSFVGNPVQGLPEERMPKFEIRQEFEDDPDDGDLLTMAWLGGTLDVYTSGQAGFRNQPKRLGPLVPGPSNAPASKTTPHPVLGYPGGFLQQRLLEGHPYKIGGEFLFGHTATGAYESDPRTWSFQNWPGADVDQGQFRGPLIVPEPVTMLSLLLAAAGVGGYVRRRRRA